MLDRQKTFDTMLAHLRQQGKPAVVHGTTSCRYRTSDGLKCAVGALIPDENYDPSIEGGSVNPRIIDLIPGADVRTDLDFLTDAQSQLHDIISEHYPTQLERNAIAFAHVYDLEYTCPRVS